MPDMSTMKQRLVVPPLAELTDFETFASAMNAAPIDDLHKYCDSEDEHDLEDNYDADSDLENEERLHESDFCHRDSPGESDDDRDNEFDDCGSDYSDFDPRFDIDTENLQPEHAASRHLNPDLQRLINKTELVLEQLSIKAQSIVEEQPMSTQIILANQAVDQIFRGYSQHGSQARFSESVMKFLSGGDTVRRPGRDGRDKSKDGKLKLAPIDPTEVYNKRGKERRDKLKRKAGDNTTLGTTRDNIEMRFAHKGKHVATSDLEPPTLLPFMFQDGPTEPSRQASNIHVNSRIIMDRAVATADSLSFRKTSGPLNIPELSQTHLDPVPSADVDLSLHSSEMAEGYFAEGPQPTAHNPASARNNSYTPLAANFSLFGLNTPTSTVSSQSSLRPTKTPNYGCTTIPSANAALAREPYNPISLRLTWPATTRGGGLPCMPTPGLLDSLNNILHLHNAEARFLLSYYVRKYDTPIELGGPGGLGRVEDEPPHALFRLGISQYTMSKVGKIIEHKERDELGLTPEVRSMLGEAWEQHPSMRVWFGEDNHIHATASTMVESGEDCSEAEDIVYVDDNHGNTPILRRGSKKHERSATARNANRIKGGLNPLEKTLLARACNISVETVEAYWDDMRDKTSAWAAMKLWCQARTREKIAKAKREDRW